MRRATADELKTIFAHFIAQKDVFPHIRQDALLRRILAGQCVYEEGVVITYQQYRKRTRVGDTDIPRDTVMLHQIVNSQQFNRAGGRVFERFCKEVVLPLGGKLFLTVREANTTARQFYERHGMQVVGRLAWKRGTIGGVIYFKECCVEPAEGSMTACSP